MTPEAAIYRWMSGFGIPAYTASSVPDQEDPMWRGFPYLVYHLSMGEFGGSDVNIPVDVYYRTESESEPNAKVREIGEAIGMGGVTIPCDGGMIWLKKGSPWAQSVTVDGEDSKVKRRLLNISAETLYV